MFCDGTHVAATNEERYDNVNEPAVGYNSSNDRSMPTAIKNDECILNELRSWSQFTTVGIRNSSLSIPPKWVEAERVFSAAGLLCIAEYVLFEWRYIGRTVFPTENDLQRNNIRKIELRIVAQLRCVTSTCLLD